MAIRARKIAANAIRKMQVPAYCPAEFGVQAVEKSGVTVEEKKVIVIMLIGIVVLMSMSVEPDIALSVAMGMGMVIDMPVMSPVAVAVPIGIDIEPIAKRYNVMNR
jgi:hypothetical protein